MAKNNNLTDFLTGVANAIRTKKVTTDLINPQDFESEIASIKTEKPEQEKSVTVTTNGKTEVTPDTNKVLSKVIVTTNVQPTLQEKTVAPTTSQQIVTADSGKDGLSKVTVNPVTSTIDSNIVAENIKKDVTILGVTGTLESGSGGSSGTPIDVATEQEMASILSNATADDNGKIYRYTGTTGTYVNGALYWLDVPQEPVGDALAGTWVFNDTLDYTSFINVTGSLVALFNFTSNGNSYTGLTSDGKPNGLQYIITGTEPDGYDSAYVASSNSWVNEAYKTIAITSKLSEVTQCDGDKLLTWLQANATKQGATTAPTLISFTIAGTSYQAEDGMTWAEWVNSKYNTAGYVIDDAFGYVLITK